MNTDKLLALAVTAWGATPWPITPSSSWRRT
jgi:hypothetical protein